EDAASGPKTREPLRAGERRELGPIPHDLALADERQQIAGGEVDEQETAARLERDVPKGVEIRIAAEIRRGQDRMPILLGHPHEARLAAAMGDVDVVAAAVTGGDRRTGSNEERVRAAHQARRIGGQDRVLRAQRPRRGDGRGLRYPSMRSRLDVLRAVAEALADADGEAQLIGRNDDPIHPVAAARLELDAEQADRRARHDVGGERIAMAGPGIDPERPRVWRGDEAWMSHQDRGPRLALRIEAADDEERQLAEQLTMLIGHEVANDFAPDLLQPRAHACAFLQGALAGMKGRVRGR